MPKIRRVEIEAFRSIRKMGINFDDATIFVGDNDSGKSNILRALNLFFSGRTDPTTAFNFDEDYNKYSKPANRKAPQIVIEITFELPYRYHKTNGKFVIVRKVWRRDGEFVKEYKIYGFNIRKNNRGRKVRDYVEIPPRSRVHTLIDRVQFEYIPAVRGNKYFRDLRGRIYQAISAAGDESFRETSKEFETAISNNVAGLLMNVKDTLGDNTRLSLPNDLGGIFKELDFLSEEKSISLDRRGDGIKARYIPLILKFLADTQTNAQISGSVPYSYVWAYEEPENNLELTRSVDLSKHLIDLLKEEVVQILFTTHSPVFYNLSNEVSDSLLHHVKMEEQKNGTEIIDDVLSDHLDEHLGVLKYLAPSLNGMLAQARDLHQEELKVHGRYKSIVEKLKSNAIIVEGSTEKIIFSRLNLIEGAGNLNIVIDETPQHAGADRVANILIASELENKNRPMSERVKKFGILDRDNAGNDAFDKISKFIDIAKSRKKAKSLVWCTRYDLIPEFEEANLLGLNIPVCLEENYPEEWWCYARDNGWLNERSINNCTNPQLKKQLVDNLISKEDLLSKCGDSLKIRYSISNDHKVKFAKYVSSKSDQELTRDIPNLIEIFSEAMSFLN